MQRFMTMAGLFVLLGLAAMACGTSVNVTAGSDTGAADSDAGDDSQGTTDEASADQASCLDDATFASLIAEGLRDADFAVPPGTGDCFASELDTAEARVPSPPTPISAPWSSIV